MRSRTKVIVIAAVTATLAAGSTAATASATDGGSSAGTPTKHVATTAKRDGSREAVDARLAARLGVSSARLDRALRAAKTSLRQARSGPTREDFYAALARELGVPLARVRQAFPAAAHIGSKSAGSNDAKSKEGGSKEGGSKEGGSKQGGSQPAGGSKRANAQRSEQQGHDRLAAAVARELHVSPARVAVAFRPLFAAGRAEPSEPIFVAAARSLGVSPAQLNTAVIQAKQSLGAGQ